MAPGDVRHRLSFSYNNQIIRNLQVSTQVNVVGGPAYGIRTGRDENGDSIFNDRPRGVGRNTLRGATHANLNMFTQYTFVFGTDRVRACRGYGDSGTVRTFDQRREIRLSIGSSRELTNRANYKGTAPR